MLAVRIFNDVKIRTYFIIHNNVIPQNHRTYAYDSTGCHRYMIDAERGKPADARATGQWGPEGNTGVPVRYKREPWTGSFQT